MCYSAQVEQSFKKLARRGIKVDKQAFAEIFRRRVSDPSVKVAKALEENFHNPETDDDRQIKQYIDEFRERTARTWETDLFAQKKRLADAQRKLATKETKKAREDERIAKSKIDSYVTRLADLRRTEFAGDDWRIFPFWIAPVIVLEGDDLVIKPMRYHCRPADKPSSYDKQFDGLYNARRDNLEGFWKNQFGRHHAFVVMRSFFENVALHDYEKRALAPGEKQKNIVLHFNPKPPTEMLVACLWDHWHRPGEQELYSFAAITDDPPPEIAATGHERCVVPLKEENLRAWLSPQSRSAAALYRILDDRERPYYEHQIAA